LLAFIPLVCFTQIQLPRKKLEGAVSIPFNLDEVTNFGNVEEEILSRSNSFPKLWGKIEIGLICYQLSTAVKADHFEIKSVDSVSAFVFAAKNKKNLTLCIYQEKATKRKYATYGSSVITNNQDNQDNQEELTSNKKTHVGII
jgi:hypothetical protein